MLEDSQGYLMAVLPATHKVGLGAVRRHLNRMLGLAPGQELAGLFKDCEPGAIPPLGEAYGIETIVDESLIGSQDIYFEAGDHLALVHVTGNDFLRLMAGASAQRRATDCRDSSLAQRRRARSFPHRTGSRRHRSRR